MEHFPCFSCNFKGLDAPFLDIWTPTSPICNVMSAPFPSSPALKERSRSRAPAQKPLPPRITISWLVHSHTDPPQKKPVAQTNALIRSPEHCRFYPFDYEFVCTYRCISERPLPVLQQDNPPLKNPQSVHTAKPIYSHLKFPLTNRIKALISNITEQFEPMELQCGHPNSDKTDPAS